MKKFRLLVNLVGTLLRLALIWTLSRPPFLGFFGHYSHILDDFGSSFGIVHHYKYRKRKYAPDTVEKFGVHVICAQILK